MPGIPTEAVTAYPGSVHGRTYPAAGVAAPVEQMRNYAVATVLLCTSGGPLGQWQTLGGCSKSLRWGHAGLLIESSLAFCALGLETSLQRGAVLALVGFPKAAGPSGNQDFDVSASVRRCWVCLPFCLGVSYGGGQVGAWLCYIAGLHHPDGALGCGAQQVLQRFTITPELVQVLHVAGHVCPGVCLRSMPTGPSVPSQRHLFCRLRRRRPS